MQLFSKKIKVPMKAMKAAYYEISFEDEGVADILPLLHPRCCMFTEGKMNIFRLDVSVCWRGEIGTRSCELSTIHCDFLQ